MCSEPYLLPETALQLQTFSYGDGQYEVKTHIFIVNKNIAGLAFSEFLESSNINGALVVNYPAITASDIT